MNPSEQKETVVALVDLGWHHAPGRPAPGNRIKLRKAFKVKGGGIIFGYCEVNEKGEVKFA